MAKGAEDALASIKVLAAMLLFPLTWTGVAAAVWLWRGMEAGGGGVSAGPPPPDVPPGVFSLAPPHIRRGPGPGFLLVSGPGLFWRLGPAPVDLGGVLG